MLGARPGEGVVVVFLQGVLVEVRGDWAAYKECFRLPGWRDKAGFCWMCDMTTSNLSDVSSDANWKKNTD